MDYPQQKPSSEHRPVPDELWTLRSARSVEALAPRRLSFVGMSINDVWQAIQEEEPGSAEPDGLDGENSSKKGEDILCYIIYVIL